MLNSSNLARPITRSAETRNRYGNRSNCQDWGRSFGCSQAKGWECHEDDLREGHCGMQFFFCLEGFNQPSHPSNSQRTNHALPQLWGSAGSFSDVGHWPWWKPDHTPGGVEVLGLLLNWTTYVLLSDHQKPADFVAHEFLGVFEKAVDFLICAGWCLPEDWRPGGVSLARAGRKIQILERTNCVGLCDYHSTCSNHRSYKADLVLVN